MAPALGIHDHENYKLGRKPPKKAPALQASSFLNVDRIKSVVHPVSAANFGRARFGLYENDRYGDCGPTSVANNCKLVSKALLGRVHTPTQAQVFDLYRRSGNPDFDPATGQGDNGVDMQTMLEALLGGGIGDIKPVAFASVGLDDDLIDAAIAVFGGVLYGVTLQEAQQQQTDNVPPRWDYSQSPLWGGHAVLAGAYDEGSGLDTVISWKMKVQATREFRARQLEEAWIVVWPWNLGSQQFVEGVDVKALESDFHDLTGRNLNGLPG